MQNSSKKKYPVKRMDISINMEKTGAHIKRSIKESGYSMREIMEITGITTEQTIYKWYSGKSIPSLETQIILCKLLGLRITELLVIDGEFDFCDDFVLPVESYRHNIIEYFEMRDKGSTIGMRASAYYQALRRIAS